MENSKINEFFDRIEKLKSIREISLDDCPSLTDWSSSESDNGMNDLLWEDLCKKLESCYKGVSNKCCGGPITIILGLIILALSAMGILALSNCERIFAVNLRENSTWINGIFIFMCITVILATLVLLIHKFIQLQSKQCETDTKLREKMLNVVVDAFNEDREFGRLRTKTASALHEKLEKARIEEWCRNKEHERRLNVMGQEQVSELNKMMLELAKNKNTVTLSNPKGSGRNIVIERSIMSNDCCDQLKEVVLQAISKDDCCCKLLKEMLCCLTDESINTDKYQKNKELLKCLFCHNEDCDKKYKDLSDKIDILLKGNTQVATNGLPVVNNINFTKGK